MRALFVKQDHASPSGLIGEAFTGLGYDVSEFTVVPAGRYHSPDVTMTQTRRLAGVSAARAIELVRRFPQRVATAPVVITDVSTGGR